MLRSVNGKWRQVNTNTYKNAVARAVKAAQGGNQNYFVYQDREDYGNGFRWEIIGERFYYEAFALPESWVKAYVGADGVIESY